MTVKKRKNDQIKQKKNNRIAYLRCCSTTIIVFTGWHSCYGRRVPRLYGKNSLWILCWVVHFFYYSFVSCDQYCHFPVTLLLLPFETRHANSIRITTTTKIILRMLLRVVRCFYSCECCVASCGSLLVFGTRDGNFTRITITTKTITIMAALYPHDQ